MEIAEPPCLPSATSNSVICPTLPSAETVRTLFIKKKFVEIQHILKEKSTIESDLRTVAMQLSDQVRAFIFMEFIIYFLKCAIFHDCMDLFRDKILMMILMCPEAAAVLDKEGSLALHHASSAFSPDFQVLQALLVAFPTGASVLNADGYSPLHLMIDQICPSYKAISLILSINTAAAK